MEKTFVEFFAGVGLIHEALRQLGWQAVLANDNDLTKARTYRANYPDVPFESCCISELDVGRLPPVTLATASFPCIDLSQAGYREGIHGAHSGLVWTFLEKVRAMRDAGKEPSFLLLENVPNLLSIDDGKAIDFLLSEICNLNYLVDVVQIDAQHFVPQSRNRAFIIAAKPSAIADGRQPHFSESHIRRHKGREAVHRNKNLNWHFFDFPQLPARQVHLEQIIEPLPVDDPRWWDDAQVAYFWELVEDDHRTRLRALQSAGTRHVFTAVRRLRRRRKREQIFNVRFDGLASCLRTPKGGSSTQYVITLEGQELRGRRLLGIEAARLQGVRLPRSAPEYDVPRKETEALFAFGDAVCVPAVKWVVEHSIERALANRLSVGSQAWLPLDAA